MPTLFSSSSSLTSRRRKSLSYRTSNTTGLLILIPKEVKQIKISSLMIPHPEHLEYRSPMKTEYPSSPSLRVRVSSRQQQVVKLRSKPSMPSSSPLRTRLMRMRMILLINRWLLFSSKVAKARLMKASSTRSEDFLSGTLTCSMRNHLPHAALISSSSTTLRIHSSDKRTSPSSLTSKFKWCQLT